MIECECGYTLTSQIRLERHLKSDRHRQWMEDGGYHGECTYYSCRDDAVPGRGGLCNTHAEIGSKKTQEYIDSKVALGMCRRCKNTADGDSPHCKRCKKKVKEWWDKYISDPEKRAMVNKTSYQWIKQDRKKTKGRVCIDCGRGDSLCLWGKRNKYCNACDRRKDRNGCCHLCDAVLWSGGKHCRKCGWDSWLLEAAANDS